MEYLEFPKITARLADHCRFSAGRRLALALTPSSDLTEVRRRQALTAEGCRLRRLQPRFALGGAHDVTAHVETAARGGQLLPPDLLEIGAFLETARLARRQLLPLADQLPALAGIAGRIDEFGPLSGTFERTLGPRGEVLDSADPALPKLRHAVQSTRGRLLERLQWELNRARAQGAAQESIVTERDGRYVIPIKADWRGEVAGVVHDVSSSGATVFIEPLAAVELGNAWREARLREQREVERILRRLTAQVGDAAATIRAAVAALAEIDLIAAKAALAETLGAPLPPEPTGAAPPDAVTAWLVEAPEELRLQSARHPLLWGNVVPISLAIGGDERSLLITGPNTGGKTVALKTVGLLALMAQAGLPVPAEAGTQFPVYASIHADIGDEQSIEQSLSTFSSHLRNVIRVLEEAGPQSLVLLDELGAGTDPVEGAALGRAILLHLLRSGATVLATTHHSELKLFAHETPGVVNASVEFDAKTLAPTYRLTVGLPGRSNALAIAQRLGLPGAVLRDARAKVAPSARSMEQLLEALQHERDAAANARHEDEMAQREAQAIRDGLHKQLVEVEGERDAILGRTEQEMERHLGALRQAIRAAEKHLAKSSAAAIAAARESMGNAVLHLDTVRRERHSLQRQAKSPRLDPATIRTGDTLYLQGMEQAGEALTPVDQDGLISVQLGALRTRVRYDQIDRVESHVPRRGEIRYPHAPTDPGTRVELRGQTLEEALPAVERFLDQAYRAGQIRLQVIHGKGTGTLRAAVRNLLRDHPLVKQYAAADRNEGGEGVTIVHLAV